MEFQELIRQRRSVRSYQPGRTVDRETVEEILGMAQMAPTWKNSQTGRYYVACTPELLEKVRAALPAFNQNSSADACALIVTTFVRDVAGFTNGVADNELGNHWGAYDLGCQSAYLVLAAREKGLDTLIMGIRDSGALRSALSIPEEEEVAAVIALGYRKDEPALRPRKELDDIAVFG